MEIKRTKEIFIEKTRRFAIRQPEADETIRCPLCGEQMLTAEMSAALFQVNCRRVYRLVEAGAVHFCETEAGKMYVCPPSLGVIIGIENDPPTDETSGLIAKSAGENPLGESGI